MNPFEMVVMIVAIVMFARVLTVRVQARGGHRQGAEVEAENLRLRDDVKLLKDRVRVLEKIVTDKGADTAAQIEALRERERMPEEDHN